MSTAVLPGAGLPDVNHGPEILGACITMTAVALLLVGTRMYVRVAMIRSVGWDDYFIVAAMVLSFTGLMVIIPEVAYGGGRHAAYIVKESDRVNGLRLNFITQPLYLFSITFVKVSIGLFLLRFAPGKGYRRFIWGIQAFMAVYTIIGFVTIVAQCQPLSVLWDGIGPAVCFSNQLLQSLAYANAAFGISSDIVFAVLPVPMLWNVQVNTRVKLALFGIMSLGVFASAASIVKLYYITTYGITGDFLFDSTNLTIWTNVECNIGIIAASIPCLKPLFKALLQGSSYFTNQYASNGKTNGRSRHNTNGYAQQTNTGTGTGNRSRKGSKSGHLKNGQTDFEMFSSKTSTGVTVSTNGRRKEGTFGDNISEESILPLQDFADSRIMKTVQVQVSHAAADETRTPRSVEDRV